MVVVLYWRRGPFWQPDAGTLFSQAVEAVAQGHDQEALDLFDWAIRRDSTQVGFHIGRGFAQLRLGRPDTARQSFDHVLRLEPGNAEAHLGLAESLLRLDQADSASAILRAMAGIAVTDSQALRQAQLLEAVPDPSGALDAYSRIASDEHLATRAALAVRAQRFEEATLLLRELLQQGREGPTTRKDLAYALDQTGRSEDALRAYESLMADGQLDEEARVRYAWLLNSMRRYGQAWQVLSSLPRPSPDPSILELQAKTALWSGHITEAASLAALWRDRTPGA